MKSFWAGRGARAGVLLVIFISEIAFSVPLRADDTNRDQAIQLFHQANAAYEQSDFGTAGIDVDAAIQLEPNFSEAYLLKGLLEYHEGQPTRGKAFMQHAYQLNPFLSREIYDHLQKRANAIENNLSSQDFAHFRLEFRGAEERDNAWEAVQYLDEAYNDLGSIFGVFPSAKIPVIILTGPQYEAVWRHAAWEAGFYSSLDGRIRIRLDPTTGDANDYRRRLRHELTHAYLYAIYHGSLPRWFNEGIAEFYAYETPSDLQWKDTLLDKLSAQLKGVRWLSVAQIDYVHNHGQSLPGGVVNLAYVEGQVLVLYIAKERGDSWIPSMMEHLRQSSSGTDDQKFAAAFQDVVGVSPDTMLQQVHDSLQ